MWSVCIVIPVRKYSTVIYCPVYICLDKEFGMVHVCCCCLIILILPIHVAQSTSSNLSCSENVAYDTVGNTFRISPQTNVNCSENTAHGTTTNFQKKDSVGTTSIGHTAVYDEVLTSNI